METRGQDPCEAILALQFREDQPRVSLEALHQPDSLHGEGPVRCAGGVILSQEEPDQLGELIGPVVVVRLIFIC